MLCFAFAAVPRVLSTRSALCLRASLAVSAICWCISRMLLCVSCIACFVVVLFVLLSLVVQNFAATVDELTVFAGYMSEGALHRLGAGAAARAAASIYLCDEEPTTCSEKTGACRNYRDRSQLNGCEEGYELFRHIPDMNIRGWLRVATAPGATLGISRLDNLMGVERTNPYKWQQVTAGLSPGDAEVYECVLKATGEVVTPDTCSRNTVDGVAYGKPTFSGAPCEEESCETIHWVVSNVDCPGWCGTSDQGTPRIQCYSDVRGQLWSQPLPCGDAEPTLEPRPCGEDRIPCSKPKWSTFTMFSFPEDDDDPVHEATAYFCEDANRAYPQNAYVLDPDDCISVRPGAHPLSSHHIPS